MKHLATLHIADCLIESIKSRMDVGRLSIAKVNLKHDKLYQIHKLTSNEKTQQAWKHSRD